MTWERMANNWRKSILKKIITKYCILTWRYSHYEVDIIAAKNDILHFIEVKARRSKAFGNPEESVTKKKIENLMKAAEEFLYQFPQWKRIQFNILSINIINDQPEFFLIEDVSL